MRTLLFLLVATLAGCGSSTPVSAGDGGGATTGDMARPPSGCQMASDCRLFSSYCTTAPCQCIPLGRDEVNPPCVGGFQNCIVDPCLNKSAVCVNHACAVSQ